MGNFEVMFYDIIDLSFYFFAAFIIHCVMKVNNTICVILPLVREPE